MIGRNNSERGSPKKQARCDGGLLPVADRIAHQSNGDDNLSPRDFRLHSCPVAFHERS